MLSGESYFFVSFHVLYGPRRDIFTSLSLIVRFLTNIQQFFQQSEVMNVKAGRVVLLLVAAAAFWVPVATEETKMSGHTTASTQGEVRSGQVGL